MTYGPCYADFLGELVVPEYSMPCFQLSVCQLQGFFPITQEPCLSTHLTPRRLHPLSVHGLELNLSGTLAFSFGKRLLECRC